MRMSVSIRGMFVGELAMFRSCSLAHRVMVLRLMMMMCGSMVVSGRLLMMLRRRMFR
jgi:hypothetical protein